MLKNVIPFIDLRGKNLVDLLRMFPDKAEELVNSARNTYGLASYVTSAALMPLADKYSRRWLAKNANPYLHEIESMADVLGVRGVFALNVCYEWGCTSGMWRTNDTISMLRVLDWPFPNLGKHMVVALQKGKAGEFYNITWPGTTGMYTGMAPDRFTACLNQAPMRKHGRGFALDWVKNRQIAYRANGMTAAHLLRQVFETAMSYAAAREILMKTPLAVPATFILGGIRPGEGCVIERLENFANVFDLSGDYYIRATNHFVSSFTTDGKGWWPREIDSAGRYRHSGSIGGYELQQEGFGWLRSPIINPNTRVCVLADAATKRLCVQGYEGSLPVTELFNMPAVAHDKQETV